MADSYILFRQGKTPVGPFDSIMKASAYIARNNLLGFAVLPMNTPEPADLDQEVVASGPKKPVQFADSIEANKWLEGVRHYYVWQRTQNAVIRNCRNYMSEIVTHEPDIGYYKIQIIKNLRAMCDEQGIQLGLKTAKDMVDDFFGSTGVEK